MTHADLSSLRAGAVEVLRRGGGSRPDVFRVRHGGSDAILKDQNGCDRAFARLLGPLLAWREARSLRKLNGLAGVPALLDRPDSRSVLMEYIPAVPITRASHPDWPAFFSALNRLLDGMHELGVAHCDLRSPNNTLVSESGEPVLVDFVASVHRGRAWNPVGRWLFGVFCRVDRKAVIKLKSIVAPELISADERPQLEHRSPIHRALRRVGISIRNLTRRLFTSSV
jgi:serine/threonine protein kinase